MKIIFDFDTIGNMDDFYIQLKQKLEFPDYFGNNLDALYDTISGDLPMPLAIEFTNMHPEQRNSFWDLIDTMKDLEEDMSGFSFRYKIKK